jgi:hypothetical protein
MPEPRLHLLRVANLAEQRRRARVRTPWKPSQSIFAAVAAGRNTFVGQVSGVEPRARRAGEHEVTVARVRLLAPLPQSATQVVGEAQASAAVRRLRRRHVPSEVGALDAQHARPEVDVRPAKLGRLPEAQARLDEEGGEQARARCCASGSDCLTSRRTPPEGLEAISPSSRAVANKAFTGASASRSVSRAAGRPVARSTSRPTC